MKTQFNDARLSVEKAREALRNGNQTEARQWAEHAASLAPEMEDPWLILAAIASPRASVEYAKRALNINPNSERARRGVDWATQRLQASSPQGDNPSPESIPDKASPVKGPNRGEGKSPSKRNQLLAILLFGIGCIICAAVAWSAYSSPLLASVMNLNNPAQPKHILKCGHRSKFQSRHICLYHLQSLRQRQRRSYCYSRQLSQLKCPLHCLPKHPYRRKCPPTHSWLHKIQNCLPIPVLQCQPSRIPNRCPRPHRPILVRFRCPSCRTRRQRGV